MRHNDTHHRLSSVRRHYDTLSDTMTHTIDTTHHTEYTIKEKTLHSIQYVVYLSGI